MSRRPTFTSPSSSQDAERVQAALLPEPVDTKLQQREQLAGAFERLGPRLFGAVCVFAALAATAKWLGWL